MIHFNIIALGLWVFTLGMTSNLNHTNYSASNEIVTAIDYKNNTWKDKLVDSVGIPEPAVNLAISGFLSLKQQNLLKNDSLITIIDFSKPSVDRRFFILDIKNQRVIKNTLVAHGRNSGVEYATSFSNTVHSNQSSLGLFVTKYPYTGKHGYSLRIDGMEQGVNDNAYRRAVVIHGADYVSESFIDRNGRLGRSYGCPALPHEVTKEIIDLIKEGSCLYIYHPEIVSKSPALPETLM